MWPFYSRCTSHELAILAQVLLGRPVGLGAQHFQAILDSNLFLVMSGYQ